MVEPPTPALSWVLLGVAALLTFAQLPARWGPITLAYGAYFHELRWAVRDGGWTAALTTWTGLHPPCYGLLALAAFRFAAAPLHWMLASGLLSTLAVALLGRAARPLGASALVMGAFALSSMRLAYGLEVNNYPLLMFAVSAQLAAIAHLERTGRVGPLVGASVLLVWTHVLGWIPAAMAFLLLAARRHKLLIVALVLCAPVLFELFVRAQSPPINTTPDLAVPLRMALSLGGRYGSHWVGAALALGFLSGARAASRSDAPLVLRFGALQCGLGAGVILTLQVTGYAAAHQRPYWLSILPPFILVAAAPLARTWREADAGRATRIAAIVLVLAAGALVPAYSRITRAAQTFAAAPVTHKLVAEAIGAWRSGGALILVAPPDYGDDDKDAVDAAYALLPPWIRLTGRDSTLPEVVVADPYWGQPWATRDGRWLYTFAAWDGARIEHLVREHHLAGEAVHLALYDGAKAPEQWEQAKTDVKRWDSLCSTAGHSLRCSWPAASAAP